MSERAELDPITGNAIAFMRRRRQELGWSAAYLAEVCLDYGAKQEPPIHSPLTRSRIAKLENRVGASLGVDEAWLLAGAFEVDLGVIITNSPEATELSPVEPTPRPVPRGPRDPLRERVGVLEEQMSSLLRVLGNLGISELPSIGEQAPRG